MDLLREDYGDGDGKPDAVDEKAIEKASEVVEEAKTRLALTAIAPPVVDALPSRKFSSDLIGHSELRFNPTFEDLFAPVVGPQHPLARTELGSGHGGATTGSAMPHAMSDVLFDQQFHAAERARGGGGAALQMTAAERKKEEREQKKKRGPREAPGSGKWFGPWESHEDVEERERIEEEEARESERLRLEEEEKKKKEGREKEPTAAAATATTSTETSAPEGEVTEKELKEPDAKRGKEDLAGGTSILHLKQERDYQGRTFVEPPTDWKPDDGEHQCFLPKKLIHTFTGHTKGVACVRLAPRYGHLALSAGLDGQLKVWRIAGEMGPCRTYNGHFKPLRDACWSHDSRQFLSCGYDKFVKLWDTETGKVVSAMNNGKVPLCVKLPPDAARQSEFLSGNNDKRVVQWDLRTGQIVLEYEPHLAAVNTLAFVDSGRKFVSSSDDKSLRVWDFGLPVPIKYIAEPHMHSMPALAVHPSGKYWAAQSLDNQIIIFQMERFRQNHKRRFTGHVVAGYACQLDFSPDGRFLISGDGDGRLWIWDWKTCKVLKTLRCHDPVCIGAQWHPLEPSRVITCGWDGTVKYWD